MFLKLTSAGFNTLFIALPDATPVDAQDEYVRRDISADDIRKLTTLGLNEFVRCIAEPSGTSMPLP